MTRFLVYAILECDKNINLELPKKRELSEDEKQELAHLKEIFGLTQPSMFELNKMEEKERNRIVERRDELRQNLSQEEKTKKLQRLNELKARAGEGSFLEDVAEQVEDLQRFLLEKLEKIEEEKERKKRKK